MITIGQEPARLKLPESQAIGAIMSPGEVVSQLIGGDYRDDPGSLKNTWPDAQSGWVHMRGEATIEGQVYPTSVTVYYPYRIGRIFAKMLGKEPNARVKLGVGNPQAAPNEEYSQYPIR